MRLAGALAIIAALALPAAAGDDTIWDRAIAADDEEPEDSKGPPAGLSKHDRRLWYGDHYAVKAAEHRLRSRRIAKHAIRAAIRNYRAAIELDPESIEAHYRLGSVIKNGYARRSPAENLLVPASRWRPIALQHWEEFERLAPRDPRLLELRRERALEYTRLGTEEGYRKAIADYASLLAAADYPTHAVLHGEVGRLASNRAEIHMMLGQMQEAITWYRSALRIQKNAEWAFGLAVAFDRDGHGLRARETMATHLTSTTAEGFVEQIGRGDIFFVPWQERYYYFALMHEVLGNDDLAIKFYEKFVRAGVHPQFQRRAQVNIETLKKRISHGKGRRQPAGHWSRTFHLEAGRAPR